MGKFNSQIRGVPIKVESELQALIFQSSGTALNEKELSSNIDDNEEADRNVTTVDED